MAAKRKCIRKKRYRGVLRCAKFATTRTSSRHGATSKSTRARKSGRSRNIEREVAALWDEMCRIARSDRRPPPRVIDIDFD
jgi:hypothetical protein